MRLARRVAASSSPRIFPDQAKAGLTMPDVSVPLATYAGWNLFNAEVWSGSRGNERLAALHETAR
jgi:hypothetical protein